MVTLSLSLCSHGNVFPLLHCHGNSLPQAALGADKDSYDDYAAFKLFEHFTEVSFNITSCTVLIIREIKLYTLYTIFICTCLDMQAETKAAFDVLKAHNLLKQKVRGIKSNSLASMH